MSDVDSIFISIYYIYLSILGSKADIVAFPDFNLRVIVPSYVLSIKLYIQDLLGPYNI